jgi:hypothetical protein
MEVKGSSGGSKAFKLRIMRLCHACRVRSFVRDA